MLGGEEWGMGIWVIVSTIKIKKYSLFKSDITKIFLSQSGKFDHELDIISVRCENSITNM